MNLVVTGHQVQMLCGGDWWKTWWQKLPLLRKPAQINPSFSTGDFQQSLVGNFPAKTLAVGMYFQLLTGKRNQAGRHTLEKVIWVYCRMQRGSLACRTKKHHTHPVAAEPLHTRGACNNMKQVTATGNQSALFAPQDPLLQVLVCARDEQVATSWKKSMWKSE